jgi:tight adherence protein B
VNILFPTVVFFIVSVLIIELCFYAFRNVHNSDHKKIRKRLRTLSSSAYKSDLADIARKKVLSDVDILNKILMHIPGIKFLDRLHLQANVQYSLGVFILLKSVLALAGYLVSFSVTRNFVISIITASLLGGMPYLYLRLKKKKRMDKFQRQLPDGMELIARSLRAGHAFTSGMNMAADEFDDPLGPEFDETLNEINFGVSVSDALKNLVNRVDCPDLKYFVVSVILHRETGGNLAEIIDSIAHIIRERFKFKRKVRTLSAEGRLSAIILIALPFLVAIAIRLINPEYINALFTEPAGRVMAIVAASMMGLGILVIKQMIQIKV